MCFLRNELFSVLCVFFSFFFSLVFNTLYILESSLSLWSFFFSSAKTRPSFRKWNEKLSLAAEKKPIRSSCEYFSNISTFTRTLQTNAEKKNWGLSWWWEKKTKTILEKFLFQWREPEEETVGKSRPTSTIILELHKLNTNKRRCKKVKFKKKKGKNGACEKCS